jgi:hypothetical protein
MKGFKQIFSALAVIAVMLAVTSFVTQGAPLSGQKPEPSMQKPIPTAIACPKIAIKELRITLLSTEVGKPLIEFPKDRVSLTVTLQNTGVIKLTDHPEVLSNFIAVSANPLTDPSINGFLGFTPPDGNTIRFSRLNNPGDTASVSFSDTFPHGLNGYGYLIRMGAEGISARCYNAAVPKPVQILIDEKALHSSGRQILTGQ